MKIKTVFYILGGVATIIAGGLGVAYAQINSYKKLVKNELNDTGLVEHTPLYNGVEHAFVAAKITLSYNGFITRLAGNGKEFINSFRAKTQRNQSDGYKDKYNNEVGIIIGEFIKDQKLERSNSKVKEFCFEALKDSALITRFSDPRINLAKRPETLWSPR